MTKKIRTSAFFISTEGYLYDFAVGNTALSSLTKSNGLVFVPAPSVEDHHRGKGHERFLRDGISNFLTQIHVCCANSFSSSKYTFDPIGLETTACIFFCLPSIVSLGN